MVAGINSSSWIPFVGWAVAAVLVASLVIYIVANWSYVREGFNSFIETLKELIQELQICYLVLLKMHKKKQKKIQM